VCIIILFTVLQCHAVFRLACSQAVYKPVWHIPLLWVQ
jgi:hypothetical protein